MRWHEAHKQGTPTHGQNRKIEVLSSFTSGLRKHDFRVVTPGRPWAEQTAYVGGVFRRPQVDADDLAARRPLHRAAQQQARARPDIEHGFVALQFGKVENMLARADFADRGLDHHQQAEEQQHREEQRGDDAGVLPGAGCEGLKVRAAILNRFSEIGNPLASTLT